MTILTLEQCSICGRPTEWDHDLGPVVLCIECWDKKCDSVDPVAEYQRRYYQEHKAQVAENKRRYRQEHKAQVAENKRRYRQEHKAEVAITI